AIFPWLGLSVTIWRARNRLSPRTCRSWLVDDAQAQTWWCAAVGSRKTLYGHDTTGQRAGGLGAATSRAFCADAAGRLLQPRGQGGRHVLRAQLGRLALTGRVRVRTGPDGSSSHPAAQRTPAYRDRVRRGRHWHGETELGDGLRV